MVTNHNKMRAQLILVLLKAMAGHLVVAERFNGVPKVIDAHVHIWSDGTPPFVFNVEPPVELVGSQAETLKEKMESSGVAMSIITQPINHLYDHEYLVSILNDEKYANRFKGILLMNPTLAIEEGEDFLSRFNAKGFVGVRFNPYLWPEGESMSAEKGLAFYKHAGNLNMPVAFMCFKGLALHQADIQRLIEASPQTTAVLDHMGFFLQGGDVDERAWTMLLELAKYPQVYVKISAFFRLSKQPWPYLDLDERLLALVGAFGSNRLLFGSDYPFVEQQGGYAQVTDAMSHWPECQKRLAQSDWENIYGKTASTLFFR